jgi:serine/threonine protein kinase
VSAINIPGYNIVKTLGVGGQATVYLAIQQGFDREVALKVMSPALAADPTFGERFIREAKIVAKLRHPGIVTVYDVGEHDGFYYLAMEYLPEKDLRSRINEGMKAKDALQVVAKVSRALHFAHEKGYIHRDVKSENILFRDDGEPVLTDFGIAKASNSSTQMTQQGKLIGTPQYMSPEQCRGRPLDGRSDIYSLGIILYEMLTQSVPFDGEDSVAVCLQHVTKPIPRLPARQKHYQWLIDRMLAKKPEDRFATGNDLAGEIDKFLAGDLSATKRNAKAELIAEREHDIRQVYAEDEQEMVAEERISALPNDTKPLRWPWMIGLVVMISAIAYLQKAHWLPQAQALYASWMQSDENHPQTAQSITDNAVTTNPQKMEANNPVSEQGGAADGPIGTANGSSLSPEQEARQKQIAQLMVEADSLAPLPNLGPAEIRTLLQNYVRILVLEPNHEVAKQRKESTLNRAAQQAREALEQGDEDTYRQLYSVIDSIDPKHPLLGDLAQTYQNYQLALQAQAKSAELKQQLSQLFANAERAMREQRLTAPAENNAYFYYSKILELEPNNSQALAGLSEIEDYYIKLAQQSLLNKAVEKARNAIDKLKALTVDDARLEELEQQYQIIKQQVDEERKKAAAEAERRRKQQEQEQMLADPLVQLKIKSKLNAARAAYHENRLVLPEVDNALAKYREVLAIDPKHVEAREGIELVKSKLVSLVKEAIQQGDKNKAEQWLAQLSAYFADHPELPLLKQQVTEMDWLMVPDATAFKSHDTPENSLPESVIDTTDKNSSTAKTIQKNDSEIKNHELKDNELKDQPLKN